MSVVDIATIVLSVIGCYFMLAGTLGLLRFPDVLNRLHAVTKADNLGLGFIVAGLMLQSGSILAAVKLLLVWLLVMFAGATSCYLIASDTQTGTEGATDA